MQVEKELYALKVNVLNFISKLKFNIVIQKDLKQNRNKTIKRKYLKCSRLLITKKLISYTKKLE